MKPIEKFKYGVKRIMRICMSYKSSAFHDLMEKVRKKIKSQKSDKELRRRSTIMRSVPKTLEERNEQILIDMVTKIEKLKDLLERQDDTIKELRNDLSEKIERLE